MNNSNNLKPQIKLKSTLATSPSTSVTDISSSNTCTPSHLPLKKDNRDNQDCSEKSPNAKNITTTFGLKTISSSNEKNYDNLAIKFNKPTSANNHFSTIERRNKHVKKSEC